MDESRITRSIPCGDAINRTRELQVVGTPGGITFIAPPGESGKVHPRHYEALRLAIRDALGVAVKVGPSAAGMSEQQP